MAGDRTVVLDTPDQIAGFVALQVYYRLKLEVNTGMKGRGQSPMQQAKIIMERAGHPTTARTKAKVLAEYGALLEAAGIKRPDS